MPIITPVRRSYDEAAKQMLAVLIGASAASQTGKSARCWTFASDELSTKTGTTYSTGVYSPDSTNECSGGTASASSESSVTYSASKAFDGNGGTFWEGTSLPAWLKYGLPSDAVVRSYKMTARSDTTTNAPKSWVLQGSNDGSTWDDLDTRTNVAAWSSAENRTYSISNTTSYLYYRCYITDSYNAPYTDVAELYLYSISNMTLVPSVVSVASAPTRMTAYSLVQPVDAITLNTDLKVEVSRDGGTNWSAYGNLRLVEAYDATYGLYKADFTAAMLPATGTSLLWRLTSYNKKQINIRGAALFWEF